jgi:hypothetical protein
MAGLLATFFHGMLALSLSFFDPFGNQDSDHSQNINVDVLLAESNRKIPMYATLGAELPAAA